MAYRKSSKHFFLIPEVGKYIAIDLSGKNLRIMLLTLKGSNQEPEHINHNYVFPASVMKGTGDQVRFCFKVIHFYGYKLLSPEICGSHTALLADFFRLYFKPYFLLF